MVNCDRDNRMKDLGLADLKELSQQLASQIHLLDSKIQTKESKLTTSLVDNTRLERILDGNNIMRRLSHLHKKEKTIELLERSLFESFEQTYALNKSSGIAESYAIGTRLRRIKELTSRLSFLEFKDSRVNQLFDSDIEVPSSDQLSTH